MSKRYWLTLFVLLMVTVVITGNPGTAAASAEEAVQVWDNTPPTGYFTSPAANATVSPPIWIRVVAQDNPGGSGINRVIFSHNGFGPWAGLATDTTPPYEYYWNMALVPQGARFLIGADIYDNAGNRRSIVRWVTRSGSGGGGWDVIPPTGDFTAPAPNATVSAPITLRVSAQDNPGGTGINRVGFTHNANGVWRSIGVDRSPPYEVWWDMAGVPSGQRFMIGAEIYDNAGNRTTRTRWITRGGGGSGDTTPPTGDFTAPAANASVTAPVWLMVQARDNAGGSGIDRVGFTHNAFGTGERSQSIHQRLTNSNGICSAFPMASIL